MTRAVSTMATQPALPEASPDADPTQTFSTDKASKPKYKNRPPYIVWSPEGLTAPIKTHATHGEALAIAHQMAKRYPGQTFRVMQAISRAITVELAIVA